VGYEEEVKTRGTGSSIRTLNINQAVMAAVASHRDAFREILGSEPIVEVPREVGGMFTISTYGAGELRVVGQFGITQLPGCCGIAVFYHASVTESVRGKGLGDLFLSIREKAAVLAGYTLAQATVLKNNDAEVHLLTKHKWGKAVAVFKNLRTKNNVMVFIKELL
jgi:hypothetical protein